MKYAGAIVLIIVLIASIIYYFYKKKQTEEQTISNSRDVLINYFTQTPTPVNTDVNSCGNLKDKWHVIDVRYNSRDKILVDKKDGQGLKQYDIGTLYLPLNKVNDIENYRIGADPNDAQQNPRLMYFGNIYNNWTVIVAMDFVKYECLNKNLKPTPFTSGL